ncbi:MAG: protein-L-isoaspartate(D-aspartate) O-methyltransferase, partial [Planctomycetota bacterium]|nr:protein-L-isoaspartate(D-aspartate) O-methyltransferase [Planctomycetota bacterium]
RARQAYRPEPLLIGEDQTISSPYIVARMTEMLELKGREKALEIGTGSGYQAAVLSLLVPHVYSIEIRPSLALSARKRLGDLGFSNVTILTGDGYKGWPSEAPFDVIIVTAAPPQVPDALVEQLAPGGRLVLPVGDTRRYQILTLIRKDENGVVTREKGERVRFVPMIHKAE